MSIVDVMEQRRPKANRGPAAAAENRTAILRSARRLFAAQGFRVPLTAIARDAGVGQGVLYRHFPTRMDLALAVFDENLTRIERTAASGGPEVFDRVWRELVTLILTDVAFVETAVEADRTATAEQSADRLAGIITPLLDDARRAGSVDSDIDVDDLFRALRAAYGLVVTAQDSAQARRDVVALMTSLGLPAPQ